MSAQFIKSGANDFLIKPFSPEEFLCRVNRAVDRIESFHELEQLNQVKNSLISTAAHDIRGPIGAIRTAADFVLNKNPSEVRQTRMLEMIYKSSDHLLGLLGELLDVSAIEGSELQLHLSENNLSETLIDRIQLYQASAEEKQISVDVAIPPKCLVQIDAIKIVQLIDNLLTNAIKYTPNGGQVEISLVSKKNEVRFAVADSGPGIPKAETDGLFKAFTTTSNKTTGGEKATGLGLAIAKKIVLAHNGAISYEPSSLGGSCFAVVLPISHDNTKQKT
jgi:signal transduction histidine kinase